MKRVDKPEEGWRYGGEYKHIERIIEALNANADEADKLDKIVNGNCEDIDNQAVRIAKLTERVETLDFDLDNYHDRLTALTKRVEANSADTDTATTHITSNMVALEKQADKLTKRVEAMEHEAYHAEGIVKMLDKLTERLDDIDDSLYCHDNRLNAIEKTGNSDDLTIPEITEAIANLIEQVKAIGNQHIWDDGAIVGHLGFVPIDTPPLGSDNSLDAYVEGRMASDKPDTQELKPNVTHHVDSLGREYVVHRASDTQELKPCLRCGGKTTHITGQGGHIAFCAICGVSMERPSWEELLEDWNNRPLEDVLRKKLEGIHDKRGWLE